jgi:hypothetical protein
MGTTLGVALIAGALVTSAGAGIGDRRSPDTNDAATRSEAPAVADYRSPDARSAVVVVGARVGDSRSADTVDAATQAHTVAPTQASTTDHRSPDARSAVLLAASTSAATSAVLADESGFSWSDAGIGATSGIVLTLILAAGAFVLMRRRNAGKVAV